MTEAKKKPRRRYSAELKQQTLAECARPDASLARVALSHGISANVVHKWRRMAHDPTTKLPVSTFVPVHCLCSAAPQHRTSASSCAVAPPA